MTKTSESAHRLSMKVNWYIERLCVFLMGVLVVDVWLGVMVRYVLPLPITFTEELARYVMIWMALLAVSSGIAHREHIGVLMIFERFPAPIRRWLAVGFDVVGFVFFALLLFYGASFFERGFRQVTMIYAIPKAYANAAVPVAAFFCCIQLALVGVRDFLTFGQTVSGRAEA